MSIIPNFIGGSRKLSTSSDLWPVYNPATGEITAQVPFSLHGEVLEAIQAAQTTYSIWSQTTPLRRARVISRFKALLEEHQNKIAQIVSLEHGKTLEDAKGEVSRAIELTEFACGTPYLLKGTYSENVGPHIDAYTVRQSLGVCLGVTPFNFPVMVPVWIFIPALACGNTFILKPSEKTPSAPIFLAKLMEEAGLPAGALNIIQGGKTVVDILAADPAVKAVSCVGSTAVAQAIYTQATAHGKRAQTFGGAKNHCIVMPDADLDFAANAIIGAAYGAAGERCMALSVVLAVGDAVADGLVDRFKSTIPLLVIASAENPHADMGPLVTREHWLRVKSYIDQGVKEGADLLLDGRQVTLPGYENGFFMGPSLFDQVRPDMRIYQEEIFGPVLCLMRVHNLSSAIALINQHPYGNGAAIFTLCGETARTFASCAEAGMIGINVPIPVPIAYHSFGGCKRSLFGDLRMHGEESVLFYTQAKTVTTRWPHAGKDSVAYTIPAH